MLVELEGVFYDEGVTAVGYVVKSTSQQKFSVRDANDPPTLGDVEAAFGFASEVGSGFLGVFQPNGSGTVRLCACDGTNWWTLPMTQLT